MSDLNLIKVSPDLSSRQKQREDFFNELRDFQWNLHLKSTAQAVKEQVYSNLNSTKNNLKWMKLRIDNAQEGVVNRGSGGVRSTQNGNISSNNNNNNNDNFVFGQDQLNQLNLAAQAILGTGNVTSRERETAGNFRRFIAHCIDVALTMVWILGWIYYFYAYHNRYLFENLGKFLNEDFNEILEDALVDPAVEPQLVTGSLLEYDNIDYDKLYDGLMESENFAQIEDDILMFTFFFKIMFIFYETVFVWFFKTTVGKRCMNIEVVHYSSYAPGNNQLPQNPDVMVVARGNLTIFRSLLRSVAKQFYFSVIFPIIFLTMPFGINRILMHDSLTKTIVVKRVAGEEII